jgi:hypothetical protein
MANFDLRFLGVPGIQNMLTAQPNLMPDNMLTSIPAQSPGIDPTVTGAIPQLQAPIQVPQGDLNYFPPAPDENRAPVANRPFELPAGQAIATPQQPKAQSGGGVDRVLGFLQGLGTGENAIQGISNAISGAKYGTQQNQTVQYLMNRGFSQPDALMIARNPNALNVVLTNIYKGQDPRTALELQKLGYEIEKARREAQGGLDAKDRYMSVGKKVFDRQTGQLVDLPGGEDASDTEYGLNPIWGHDADGNPVLGVLGKDGSFKKVDTGSFDISTGTEQIDLGDSFAIKDKRSGQIVGTVPKNLANAERDKKAGAAQGEALASYRSMSSKLPGLEVVIKELGDLSDKATYTTAGKLLDAGRKELGMSPRDSALARSEYIAKVDNQVLPMLRDTFGAAFTQKEGETLRATLGDPDKSPAEKKAVLQAFINQKRRDIEALALQASLGDGAPASAPGVNVGGYIIEEAN